MDVRRKVLLLLASLVSYPSQFADLSVPLVFVGQLSGDTLYPMTELRMRISEIVLPMLQSAEEGNKRKRDRPEGNGIIECDGSLFYRL
jgi:hypothetical protein